MRSRFSNRGVALLLVLGAIMMLTIAVSMFADNTDIQFELAYNERDRLQAEYLAYSATNLMLLELQMEKSAKSMLANAPAAVSEGLGSTPLCQKFPMSSSLLKAIFLGGMLDGNKSAADGEVAPPIEKKDGPVITGFQQEAAKEFLDFSGDFDGQCADLQTRINLNQFFDLDPAQQAIAAVNPYDQLKLTIMSLLQQPVYKELFDETKPDDIKNIVRNIADWIDKNDVINELSGLTGGPETSLYDSSSYGAASHQVKNGKMLTLDEVYLVKDVLDDWFTPFREIFTVYGDNKVNICQADDSVVMAVLARYLTGNQRFGNIDLTKPELKEAIKTALATACEAPQPKPAEIAQAIDAVLAGNTDNNQGASTSQPANPSSQTPVTASNLTQLITTETQWYELKSTGQVGDVIVHLTQVWDTKGTNPSQWKLIYSKLE